MTAIVSSVKVAVSTPLDDGDGTFLSCFAVPRGNKSGYEPGNATSSGNRDVGEHGGMTQILHIPRRDWVAHRAARTLSLP